MNVGLVRGSSLVEDYVAGHERVGRFFGASYLDPSAFPLRASELDRRFGGPEREETARILEGAGMGSEYLGKFVDEGALILTTGQQPGLFGGPLYSIYKGLSAVAWARTAEEVLQRPVLPLFWVASEDHDWDEAGVVRVLDTENELRSVEVELPAEERSRPIFRVVLEDEMEAARERFLSLHPETDFSPEVNTLLGEAFRSGRTLDQGFVHFLRGLLAPHGIEFVCAHEPELKQRSLPILLRELDAAAPREEELRSVAGELEERGYPVQVPILDGAVNLFLEGPAGRERLYRREEGGFRLRHSDRSFSRAEVQESFRRDPSLVSPNVLLRPVVENALFPVLGYVAGPGEIGYFAQLHPMFRGHDMEMPVVLPRHSVLLLERKIQKVLGKFDLEPAQLRRPHHEVAGEVIREEIPPGTRRALGRLRQEIAQGAGELAGEVAAVDPTLKGPVEQVRSQALQGLDDVERRIVQSLKRENQVALDQIRKAQGHLFPDGKPQERTLNVMYYLVRYGGELVDRLLEEFRRETPVPQVAGEPGG